MLIKVIGIIFVVIGLLGLVLPIIPGFVLIIIGGLLLFEEKLYRIKEHLPERFPEPVAIFYNWLVPSLLKPYFSEIAKEVIKYKSGINLLDIGSGPGTILIEVAKNDPSTNAIGIDISKKMVELANKNREISGDGVNPAFISMSAEALALPSESFDLVLSTLTLHLVKSPDKMLSEMYRVLRSGGEAWIYDGYDGTSLDDVRSATKRFMNIFPPASLVRCIFRIEGYTEKEYNEKIGTLIKNSPFKGFIFERRGIMMKIILKK